MDEWSQAMSCIENLRRAVLALIEVVGRHPDFNGPLSDALVHNGVDGEALRDPTGTGA